VLENISRKEAVHEATATVIYMQLMIVSPDTINAVNIYSGEATAAAALSQAGRALHYHSELPS